MAQGAKAKKSATGASSAVRSGKSKSGAREAAKSAGATGPGGSDIARLEAECQALKAELMAAREEIARLEKRQELVVNRIDWVIDSLHNLLEDEG